MDNQERKLVIIMGSPNLNGNVASAVNAVMSGAERAKQLKIDIPAIFLALQKKDTPLIAKILASITVAYALSPIDIIPDFIPVLGYLDDVIVLPTLIALTVRFIPKKQMAACRTEAEGLWKNGKPKQWWYAIPIVLIWILCIWLIVGVFL